MSYAQLTRGATNDNYLLHVYHEAGKPDVQYMLAAHLQAAFAIQ